MDGLHTEGDLPQVGFSEIVSCGPLGCVASYAGFYEYYNVNGVASQANPIIGYNVAPGDLVSAEVLSLGTIGGEPVFYFALSDATESWTWSMDYALLPGQNAPMFVQGEAVAEIPEVADYDCANSDCITPVFSQLSFTGYELSACQGVDELNEPPGGCWQSAYSLYVNDPNLYFLADSIDDDTDMPGIEVASPQSWGEDGSGNGAYDVDYVATPLNPVQSLGTLIPGETEGFSTQLAYNSFPLSESLTTVGDVSLVNVNSGWTAAEDFGFVGYLWPTSCSLGGVGGSCTTVLPSDYNVDLPLNGPSEALSVDFTIPTTTPTGVYYVLQFCLEQQAATFDVWCSTPIEIEVVTPVAAATVDWGPATADAGQTVSFDVASTTGGAGPFEYFFTSTSEDPFTSSCYFGSLPYGASEQTCTVAEGAATESPFYLVVWVYDTATEESAEIPLNPVLTVYSTILIDPITFTPGWPQGDATGTLDVTQTVSLSWTPNGGSGNFAYSWTSPTYLGCAPSTSNEIYCTPTADGSYAPTLTVTDLGTGGTYTVTGSPNAVTVYNLPTVSSPVPSVTSADISQSVMFTSSLTTSNGYPTGGDDFTWYWSESSPFFGCTVDSPTWTSSTSTVSDSISCQIDSIYGSGSGKMEVYVMDPNGCFSGTSQCGSFANEPSLYFDVYEDPIVSAPTPVVNPLSANPLAINFADVGQQVTFSTSTSFGAPGTPTYTWTETDPGLGCDLTGAGGISCYPSSSGIYLVYVYVTDTNGCASGGSGLNACTEEMTVHSELFLVYPDPALTLSGGPNLYPDVGQQVMFTPSPISYGSGSSDSDTLTWSGPSFSCPPATSISSITCTATTAGVYTFTATLTDPSDGVASASVSGSIFPDPVVIGLAGVNNASIVTDTVDLGQSIALLPTMNVGSATLASIDWVSADPSLDCSAQEPESPLSGLECTPSEMGSFDVSLQVTDANAVTSPEFTMAIVVYCDPEVSAPYSTTHNPDDYGSEVHLEADPYGGSGTYSYVWSGLPSGCESDNSEIIVCTPNPHTQGSYTIDATVTDSDGWTFQGPTSTFVVTAPPTVSAVSSVSSVDLGQSVTFIAEVSGGSGIVTYSWSGLPAGCTSVNAPSITCTPSAPGGGDPNPLASYSISVEVSDTSDSAAFSRSISLTLYTDPEVSTPLNEGYAAGDAGQEVDFSILVSGGAGGYSYDYSGLPSPCDYTDSDYAECFPSTSGVYSVSVSVTDANGLTVSSGPESYTVYSDVEVAGDGTVAQTSELSLGVYPWAMYVDSSDDIAYISNTVEVSGVDFYEVDLTDNSVVQTGSSSYIEPRGIWYDDATGLVWVAFFGSGVLASFDGATGALETTINVCPGALTMADDPAHNALWITCYEHSEVIEVSLDNYDILATLYTATAFPYYITLDPTTELAFVTDSAGDDLVQVINADTQAFVASVSVPNYPYSQDIVTTVDQNVVVTSTGGGGLISEFPESDFSDVTTIQGPAGAFGLAYDPQLDLLAVGGQSANDVQFYCASSFAPLTLSGPTPSIDQPLGLGFDSALNALVVESSPSPGNGGYLYTYDVTQLAGLCPDSQGLDTPMLSAPAVDLGQPMTFSVAASGGLGPYTYVWSGLPGGCPSENAAVITCTPTSDAVLQVSVAIIDANGYTVVSQVADLGVAPALTVPAPVPSSSTIDSGVSYTISDHPSGGSGTYSRFTWEVVPLDGGSSSLGCDLVNSGSVSCTPTGAGNYTVDVFVTDSNGNHVGSEAITVQVVAPITVSTPVASPSSLDLGQTTTIAVVASGGWGTLSYVWSGLPTGCTTEDEAAISCTPTAAGTFSSIEATVFDTSGDMVASATLSLTVYSDPTASTPTATPSSVDVGETATLSTSASGGSGGYSYSWSGLPAGCSTANSASLSCTPTSAGTFSIVVSVADSNGFTVSSGTLSFSVLSDPTIGAPTASAESFGVGQSFQVSVSASGGAGGFSYAWSESGSGLGCTNANSATISCDPTTLGTYTVAATATDANGFSVTSPSLQVNVMNWNAGSLCSVSQDRCAFTGSSHCAPALYYDFNGSLQTLSVSITGSSDCVFFNVSGSHLVLNLQITASSLPYVQLIVAGQRDDVNLQITGSSDSAFVYVFGQHDVYNLTATCSSLTAKTYFLGFDPRNDSAPLRNASNTDTYHLSIVGSNDQQNLTYVNSVGWASAAHRVAAPANIATGSNDYLVYQNLTGVWAGPWDTSSGNPSFIPSTPTARVPSGISP